MNESNSIKKLIMDLASQIALDENLDTVRFHIRPPEYSYTDCISVTFYKEKHAVDNIFPINEFLDMKSDLRSFASVKNEKYGFMIQMREPTADYIPKGLPQLIAIAKYVWRKEELRMSKT